MRNLFIIVSAFFLLSCEADPGHKRTPLKDAKFVSKGVGVNFFPQVDILFVIDDSGSMEEFQFSLSNNVNKFVDKIFQSQFIDFHIGVTTSNDRRDLMDGETCGLFGLNCRFAPTWNGRLISRLDRKDKNSKGPNFVNRNTPDGLKALETYLKPGADGNGTEIFFDMVRRALTPPIVNKENFGFYRPNAHLVIFFLTDAEDQSVNFTPKQFYNFLLGLKNGNKDLIHYAGAIGPVGTDCRGSSETPPYRIEEFAKLIDGKHFNMCKSDYGEELVQVASDLIERVSKIYLDDIPVLSTLELVYGTQTIPQSRDTGWTYNPNENVIYLGKNLVLEEEPLGTQLQVHFESIFK